MNYKNMDEKLLKSVNPSNIDRYIKSLGWFVKFTGFNNSTIYEHVNFNEQILVPYNIEFEDYAYRIGDAIKVISDFEKRNTLQILNDLVLPPSDILRFKVDGQNTYYGAIPLLEGIALFENGRKLLYATSLDYTKPSLFHAKLGDKEVSKFLESCMLGQSERGSYVASIICPIKDQKTLTDNRLTKQMGRETTIHLMKSLDHITKSIRTNKVNDLTNPEKDKPIISYNFFTALASMRPSNNSSITISVSWSPIEKPQFNIPIPQQVKIIDADYKIIDKIINELKPNEESQNEKFVGKVHSLMGDEDEEGHKKGDVVLVMLKDDESIKAKVYLNPIDHAMACDAYKHNIPISIEGKLIWADRMKKIESYKNFKVIK